MQTIIIKDKFESAHMYKDYPGKPGRPHGHTWKIEAEFEIIRLDEDGISIIPDTVRELVRLALPDYQLLNTMCECNPTPENLSKLIFFGLKDVTQVLDNVSLKKITLWETEENGATYEIEDDEN